MNNHPIRPIKNEQDYEQALKTIEKLFDAVPGTPEGDRLDILVTLVDFYEEKQQYSLPFPDPIEAITYHMETRGLSAKDLSDCFGSVQVMNQVLEKEVPLSIEMVRALQKKTGISAEVLIQPYSLRLKAA